MEVDEELRLEHLRKVRENNVREPRNGLICYTYNMWESEPGYYVAKFMNIGDYIQSLAALQFLSGVSEYVDRDRLGEFRGERVNIVMNAWYHFWKRNKVPAEAINPLLVAVHIDNRADMPAETLDYLRRHEPVGCRDVETRDFLRGQGIRAYFSGCLTLTLGRTYRIPDEEREDEILFVDYRLGQNPPIDCELKKIMRPYDRCRRRFLTKFYPRDTDVEGMLNEAEQMVRRYARAKLVITANVHCAFPCLAVGTPVVFVMPSFDPTRFSGLRDLLNVIGRGGDGKFVSSVLRDGDGMVRNPDRHVALAKFLSEICEAFAGQRATLFAGLNGATCRHHQEKSRRYRASAGKGNFIFRKFRDGDRRIVTVLGFLRFSYRRRSHVRSD